MLFFHERWNDLYNGECDHCGVIHQDPRPTTQRTAFFDIPYIETGYNLHFGSCSEFLKLPDTESNLRHSGDKSLNVNGQIEKSLCMLLNLMEHLLIFLV